MQGVVGTANGTVEGRIAELARAEASARGLAFLPPFPERVDERHQGQTLLSERVVNVARIAGMIRAAHDTCLLKLPEFEGKHPMRHRRIVFAKIAESLGAIFKIVKQQRWPAAAQDEHCRLNRAL